MKILSFVLCVMLVLGSNAYGGERGECPKDTIPTPSKTPPVGIDGTRELQSGDFKFPKGFSFPRIPWPHLPGYTGEILETHCGIVFSGWSIKDQKEEKVKDSIGRTYFVRTTVWAHYDGICTLAEGHSGPHHGATSLCGRTKTTTEARNTPFVHDPKEEGYWEPPKPKDPYEGKIRIR